MTVNSAPLNEEQEAIRRRIEAQLAHTRPDFEGEINRIFEDMVEVLHLNQAELENQNRRMQQIQSDLEKTKAHYVDLYDNAPVGYLTVDTDGIIREINTTASLLIGTDCKQVLNRAFVQFIADEYRAIWHRHFENAKQHGGNEGCELPFNVSDHTRYLHINCRYLPAEESFNSIRITLTDVTERKLAEADLRIAATAFETQEGMIVTDAEINILRVNQAFVRITGFIPDEAVGKNLKFLYADFHACQGYPATFATAQRQGYWQGEIWSRRKSGEFFPVLQTITAVKDNHGRLTHFVATLLDITVQKQAEKVLIEARNRLENQVAQSQEEIDRIKSETSEVNTALNVLLRQRETDKSDAQLALSGEVEATVLPLLKKLKTASIGRLHSIRLIKILEENVQQLVASYGRTGHLSALYLKLTPLETQVASMIRQGQPTKVIATALNIAPGTVSIHRKHIRKKLGLDGKKDNLHSFLQSLID